MSRRYPAGARGADVPDAPLQPVREVEFTAWGRRYVACVYGPPEDGAYDVVVHEVRRGECRPVGVGVYRTRLRRIDGERGAMRAAAAAMEAVTA